MIINYNLDTFEVILRYSNSILHSMLLKVFYNVFFIQLFLNIEDLI